MGSLLYFALIGIQLTNVLSIETIPLKCFLQDYNFLNIFDTSTVPTSPNWISTNNTLRFNTIRVKSVTSDKDGWFYDATNLEYQGLDDAVLDEFGINLVTNVSQITFHTDILVTNLYKTNGTLFSMPIDGEGSSEVRLKNVQFSLNIPFDILEANGNKYIELRNFNYWYNIKDNAEFRLSNLYYGYDELSDTMHYLLNQNWKFLTSHFGKVFLVEVVDYVFNVFRDYMRSMTLKDYATC